LVSVTSPWQDRADHKSKNIREMTASPLITQTKYFSRALQMIKISIITVTIISNKAKITKIK